MDKGKIAEFDSPTALKSIEGKYFFKKACLYKFITGGIYSELFKASGHAAET